MEHQPPHPSSMSEVSFMSSVYYPQPTPFPQFQFSATGPVRTVSHPPPSSQTAMPHFAQFPPQQPLFPVYHQNATYLPSAMTKKPQQTKDERRAEHNAIERARRESLNTKFQQLAHLLPNLQNDTRPSKSTIIERTLEFVKQALQKEERYRHELRDLRHTNRQLLNRLSDPAPSSNVPSVSSEPMHYPSASPSPFMLSLTPTPTMPAASLPTSSMSTMSSMSSSCVALDPSYCDPSTQHHPTACDPILFGQLPLQAMVGSPCESEEELNELDLQHHHNSMMNYAHHLQMYSQDHNAKATSVPFASPSISMPLFQ